MDVRQTDEDVEELVDRCIEAEDTGRSKFPGMNYEQGITAALHWALDMGVDQDHPLDD